MAVVVPRIMDENLFQASANTISADSAASGLPVRYLNDKLRSKPWRSGGPWVIVTGWNDKLDFVSDGNTGAATIAAGVYSSGDQLSAAIVAALEAADSAPDWAVSYDFTNLNFTIQNSLFSLDLLFGTGANLATSVHPDLGFASTDETGAVTYSSPIGSTAQSRHYIACDFGSATAITTAILLEDNVSASGSVAVRSSATSILDALTAPDATQVLTDRGDHWHAYFNSQSHRYVVFYIDDRTNTDGFSEAGIAFLGTYRSPKGYSAVFSDDGEDMSQVVLATEGAPHGDQRPEARMWNLGWRALTTTQKDVLEDFRTDTPKGKCFFFDFDSGTPNIVYGYRSSPMPIETEDGGNTWKLAYKFVEALG